MLAVVPLIAALGLGAGVVGVLLVMAAGAGKITEDYTGIEWDPIWLSSEGAWGFKIHKASKGMTDVNPSGVAVKKDALWLQILHDGEYCKGWTFDPGTDLGYIQSFARTWAASHPEGCL
jgi:hypothetical protein